MFTVLLVVVLFLAALAVFWWAFTGMLTHVCPVCHEHGSDESVIPVLPLYRWWCPSCTNVHKHADVLVRGEDIPLSSEQPPQL